jgi:hypothetical protein
MRNLLAWCFVIALTATTNLQMDFVDLQERVGEYKEVQTSRELSVQEQSDLNELMTELNALQNEMNLSAAQNNN